MLTTTTRALLRLERTINLFGGKGRGGKGGREGGREGGMEGRKGGGRGGRGGREGGREGRRDDCYTYSNRYVQ